MEAEMFHADRHTDWEADGRTDRSTEASSRNFENSPETPAFC